MMRIAALFHLALWSAFSRPMRAALMIATLAGGTAGVALTAGVLSGYARAMEALTFGAYSRSLVISENRLIEDRFGPPRVADIARLREVLGDRVEATAAWRMSVADVRAGREQTSLTVFGVSGAFGYEADMPVVQGRVLTAAETAGTERLCLLGPGAFRMLFPDGAGDAASFRINGVSCSLAGVLGEPRSQLAERYRNSVITPFAAAARYFEAPDSVSFPTLAHEVERLTIVLTPGTDRDAALIDADRALRRAHGASQTNSPPFIYADPAAPAEAMARQRDLIARLLIAIALVSIMVAVTGYAAASMAAVDMKKRDIALMMMSGASAGNILVQVLMEGLVLGAVGGIAGIILVGGAAALAQAVVSFPFDLDLKLGLLVLAGGAATGLLASIGPARKAASGSPALNSRS
ncbi:ABC transporter permease [uncultured Maricaulis sp.]|uniref:ABC transporter permease n=1 Tax=uncultured Maricaulis sp. TaxID=174710 RepID=UPI0030D7FE90|tara:strand:+ start:41749 stop:42972 length:1224 start_codon:yes stop_codon:yes gene_type:complete